MMHGQLMMFPQPKNTYSSLFLFSPPTLNNGSLHDIISSSSASVVAPSEPAPPRDRPAKKDRHRKINTAKGLRDRRMRLSLDVARKFFDLQDLLAFDKASKTVQWLLNKSKAAIKDHVAAAKGKASSFECVERVSVVSEKKTTPKVLRKRRSRMSVKPKVARECRDKARARARERTLEKKKEKMMMMMQCGRLEEEGSKEFKLSLEMLAEMGDESIAILYYNDGVENSFQDPWEINLMENMEDRALLGEVPVEMSYGSPMIQPVFDHM